MLSYKSDHLEMIEDFDLYLSDKIKEIEGVYHQKRLDQIDDIIQNKPEKLKEKLKEWIEHQLDDNYIYYEYSNYFEVHDITIIDVDTNIEDYKITNVSEDYISVQIKFWINYKVEIIMDDEDYMYKDSDTKDWIFYETKPMLIDEIRYIDVDVIFDIEADDDTVYEPEIETVNNGRNLNV